MDIILLSPDLQITVSKLAEQEAKSADEVLHEAIRRYQRELNRDKLKREITAYEALHAQLKEKHLGEWVALHEGQLIDHDSDGGLLHKRLREQYGTTAILIRQVEEQPSRELWLRTPSTGRIDR